MSESSINLLPQKGKLGKNWRKILTVTRAVSFFMLAAVVFSSFTMAVSKYYLKGQVKYIQESLARTKKEIEEKKNTEIIITLLKKRTGLIGDVIKSRDEPDSLFNSILGILPAQAEIINFQFAKKEAEISLEMKDAQAVDQFLDNFPKRAKELKPPPKEALLSDVKMTAEGKYAFTLKTSY